MPDEFTRLISDPVSTWEALYDSSPDTVFFLKDADGRYQVVNRTLVERCGFKNKSELIGKTTVDLFPDPLGQSYLDQDLEVIEQGESMPENLELHVYPGGFQGWCVTTKLPLHDADGKVVGVAGVSRDLHMRADKFEGYEEFSATLDYIRKQFAQQLRIDDLAEQAGLSVYQYETRMKKVLGMPAGHFISRVRLEAAIDMLKDSSDSVAEVALACGFYDQSAFARTFKNAIGMTPSQYRKPRQE
jgi:PAS domain S-box-containing protein